jgi:hypothetical protein
MSTPKAIERAEGANNSTSSGRTARAMPGKKSTTSVYVLFCLLELAGLSCIFWDGIPIYRALVHVEQVATRTDGRIMLVAAGAIQLSYWYCLRHAPPFAIVRNVFFGHVILFVSRLVFVFGSSLFALVAYRYSDVLDFSPRRIFIFVAVLFSLFCISRHLEGIGNQMVKSDAR